MKVATVVRLSRSDGWVLVTRRGSQRQFTQPSKPGRVIIAGRPNHDLAPGALKSIMSRPGCAAAPMNRYAIVIEQAGSNDSAFVPDLPGCAVTTHLTPRRPAASGGQKKPIVNS